MNPMKKLNVLFSEKCNAYSRYVLIWSAGYIPVNRKCFTVVPGRLARVFYRSRYTVQYIWWREVQLAEIDGSLLWGQIVLCGIGICRSSSVDSFERNERLCFKKDLLPLRLRKFELNVFWRTAEHFQTLGRLLVCFIWNGGNDSEGLIRVEVRKYVPSEKAFLHSIAKLVDRMVFSCKKSKYYCRVRPYSIFEKTLAQLYRSEKVQSNHLLKILSLCLWFISFN